MLLIGFIVLLAFDTLGQVAFKLAGEHAAPIDGGIEFLRRLSLEPWVLAIVAAYFGAFLTYMTLIKDAPIGPLFAASHLEIVTVSLISILVFGERLALVQIVGCLAILGGVCLLAATEEEVTSAGPISTAGTHLPGKIDPQVQ
ncbi:MAG: EamA family transporter [Hyphomicrobiales bacterium]